MVTQEYNKMALWTVAKSIELIGKLHNRVKSADDSEDRNRNFDDVQDWTKKNINEILHKIRRSEIPDEVFVCLFHPDEIIYSTAAKVIFDENPIKCAEYLENMSEKKQALLSELTNDGHILSDKIKLLKKHPMFFAVPEHFLSELAILTDIKTVETDQTVSTECKNSNGKVIIVIKGSLETTDFNGNVVHFNKNEIIMPDINIHKSIEQLKAVKPTTIITIDKYDYFDTLLDRIDILYPILESIS